MYFFQDPAYSDKMVLMPSPFGSCICHWRQALRGWRAVTSTRCSSRGTWPSTHTRWHTTVRNSSIRGSDFTDTCTQVHILKYRHIIKNNEIKSKKNKIGFGILLWSKVLWSSYVCVKKPADDCPWLSRASGFWRNRCCRLRTQILLDFFQPLNVNLPYL